jgi:protein-S-isoprenylcysteine O-methyltransferase Ste14
MHNFIDYRPPRIAMSFVLIALAANAFVPLPMHTSLPFAAGLTGGIGFWLMMRAWWLFRLADTAICPTASSTTLVTHGIFAITRNPMYLGMFLMLLGIAMVTGSAPFYVAAAGYGVVMDRVFCPHEEKKSVVEFGQEYVAYLRRVRRWL